MTIKKHQGWRGLLLAAAALLMLSILPVSALAAEPANTTINIPVYMQVAGDTPKTDEAYTFHLNAVDGAPMPDGSVNGTKTVWITGEGNTSFGQISYTELGEYHYTISETKENNQRYTYDKTVYSANVQVSWKNKVGGEMIATLYLAKEDGIYKQDKALFINRYTAPTPILVDPPVQKMVIGTPTVAGTFTFRFAAESAAAPMPDGSSNGVKTFSRVGPGLAEAGMITFTEPGEYSYTVSEVNSGVSGYTYDKTVYRITFMITEENGQLQQSTQCYKADGTAVSAMSFTNTYKSTSVLSKTGEESSPYTWIIILLISLALIIFCVIGVRKMKCFD